VYVVPPTRFVEPSESVATCSADPDVTATHPGAEATGQAPLCTTHATFSVVPALGVGDGSWPVTATSLATEPVAAETVGAFNGLAVAWVAAEHAMMLGAPTLISAA
jgi:hypothetical protein